jgi:hypothetical protein
MLRKLLFLALAVTLTLLLAPSRAQAQGGLHGSISSVSSDGTVYTNRTSPSASSAAHWDPYRGQWVGGKYGYGPDPASERGPYYGSPYGSPSYAYYGGYLSNSVYAAGLRTGLYSP